MFRLVPTSACPYRLKSDFLSIKNEKRCTPGVGTKKEDVKKIFRKGKPAANSKIPPKVIPEDSPYRTYELSKNGTLFVCYAGNKIKWAHYINPYSIKGIPIGKDLPVDQKISEAKKRLNQMEIILKEYLRKTENL